MKLIYKLICLKQKNKLPKYTQEIIYECISDPIEKTLRQIYKSSFETINVIKNTISSILIDNWACIYMKSSMLYVITLR